MGMIDLRRTVMDKGYKMPKVIITDDDAVFYTDAAKALSVVAEFLPIQSGSGTPSSMNVRPFVGKTGLNLWHSGVNIWDEQWISGMVNSDGTIDTSTARVCSKNFIPVEEGKKYTLVWSYASWGRVAFYDASKNFVSYTNEFPGHLRGQISGENFGEFTIPSGACYMKFNMPAGYGTTYKNDISINWMMLDPAYHAFNGHEYSISFPETAGTVYGAEVDITEGKLSVTWGHIASYAGETIPGEWKSDRDEYAEGSTPTTGAEVVYKLSTPSVYDFTGEEISSYVGKNLMWTNLNDDVQVTYGGANYGRTLTIMTYNVQSFNDLNADETMQNNILNEYAPHIIGLQEIGSGLVEKAATILSPKYWNLHNGSQLSMTAIATNIPLSNVEYHQFATNGSEVKGYQTAEFMYKGRKVFFINTHLFAASNASVNAAQAEELFNLVQTKETFIIVGDLNTDCDNTSDTQYINVIKPFVDAGYKLANCSDNDHFIGTWSSGKSAAGPWKPEDHIITSADFTMSNVRRDTIKIAAAETQNKTIDHVALICELTL